MKHLFSFLVTTTLLVVASCVQEYDDSELVNRVDNLEERVTRLEELCEMMNSNIKSIETVITALQQHDYIANITEVYDNDKVIGYTITFIKSGSITIYHGTDGEDGEDGEDGYTPQIGVRQDSNGIYYWTIDGEWLLDNNGEKIRVQGKNGTNGEDGEDGKDGITPQLKIKDEYWYISYDNGTTWVLLGKATGEDGKDGEDGEDGEDGKDGDSFFKSVTQDEQNVYFELADGSTIVIPKETTLSISFDEDDLQGMHPNSTRTIGYNISSCLTPVTVEVISSADIKAQVVTNDEFGLTGDIEIKTGSAIDEYSKVIILASNGKNVIMRSIIIEEAGLTIDNEAVKNIGSDGGDVELSFLTNVECEVVIPEDAQSWIFLSHATRAMEERSILLNIAHNTEFNRSAVVRVQSTDGILGIDYTLNQEGDLGLYDPTMPPFNEIWYTSTNETVVTPYTTSGFGATIVSNTYSDGKGIIKFDGNVTNLPIDAFRDCQYLSTLSLPYKVTNIGYRAFRACVNLTEFSGKFASDDGRCFIVNNSLAAYAYGSGTEYNVPESVTSIAYGALYGGRNIKKIALGDNVTAIGDSAFWNNLALESVSIGSGVIKIGSQAFSYSRKLKELFINALAPPTLSGEILTECHEELKIYVPAQSLAKYKTAKYWEEYADIIIGVETATDNDPTKPAQNEIWYTSTDDAIIIPTNTDAFGANIVSNTYENGKGVITFDNKISEVGYNAFYESKDGVSRMTSVTIPIGVTSIGTQAFYRCDSLESIVIPGSVITIGTNAFSYTRKLSSITLPDSVGTLGSSLFSWSGIENVTLPSSITSIPFAMFDGCANLQNIVIPNSVKTISAYAFQDSGITSITIPNNVTTIGDCAFKGCANLKTFKGKYASDNGRNLTKEGVLIAYADGSGDEYTIPSDITSIGEYAFYWCANLKRVVVPGNVKTIGRAAFANCENLTKVTISNGVTTIGASAFTYCANIKRITIPESVTIIDNGALHSCDSLEEIYCMATTPPKVGEPNNLLFPSWGTKVIYVPTQSVSIYKSTDKWSIYSDIIKGYDFTDFEEPEDIEVPNRETPNNNELFYTSSNGAIVTPYNTDAFNVSITSNIYSQDMDKGVITFSGNLTAIEAEAFKNCSTLTGITFPDSLKRIETYAFAGSGLTSLSLPDATYGIGDYAFYNCRNLTVIDLNKVVIIGSYAFKDCSLTSVYIPETADSFGHGPFKCSTLTKFSGPNLKGDSKSLYVGYVLVQLADGACKDMVSYTVPSDVLTICEGVFQDCSKLESVTLPDGLQTIYAHAFDGCSSLTKVIIPSSLSVLYNYAFDNCTSLKSLYFNGNNAPTCIYDSGDTWQACEKSTVVRVPAGHISSYTNQYCWADYNVVEFNVGDYSHDDVPSGGNSGDEGDEGGNGEIGTNHYDVVELQRATEGNGIDIVIMGDAYSQSDINSGKYSSDLSTAIEALFSEEPYKSFRHLFNVYQVTVVSPNSGYNSGATTLGGFFGNGTLVGGDNSLVAAYAELAVDPSRINEATIIVIMNRKYYAGTCYMFYPVTTGDYGPGASISYFPLGTNDEMFGQLILHEAGGHGFAKLDDEYAYQSMGSIPNSEVESIKSSYSNWGWGKNIDITNNTALVRWSKFLNDTRYYYDGLGVYEGGHTYWRGVWRPTYNSIMNDNTGGFNAPSREAIYYRIHKLAYGSSWTYNYETFVSWDSRNRKTSLSAIQQEQQREGLQPTHPPVVVATPLSELR